MKNIFKGCCCGLGMLALAGCGSGPTTADGLTVIEGYIGEPADSKVYFYSYRDSADYFIDRLSAMDSAVIDSAGNFSMHPSLDQSAVFSLRHVKKDLVANLYLRPGDQIGFRFLGKGRHPRIVPFGAAARFNTYLLRFQDTFYREKEARRVYYIVSNYMSPGEFAAYTDDRREKMQAFFRSFFGNDSLPDEYRDFARYSIDYEYACDRLMYVWKKRMKGEDFVPDPSFFAFLTPSFIENADALITPSYVRFINLYLKEVYESRTGSGSMGEGRWVPSVEKYRICDSLFHPPVREVVLYNLLVTDLHDVAAAGEAPEPVTRNLDSLLAAFKVKYSL